MIRWLSVSQRPGCLGSSFLSVRFMRAAVLAVFHLAESAPSKFVAAFLAGSCSVRRVIGPLSSSVDIVLGFMAYLTIVVLFEGCRVGLEMLPAVHYRRDALQVRYVIVERIFVYVVNMISLRDWSVYAFPYLTMQAESCPSSSRRLGLEIVPVDGVLGGWVSMEGNSVKYNGLPVLVTHSA
jgi:hypothetical protein